MAEEEEPNNPNKTGGGRKLSGGGLDINESELFDIFQRHRADIEQWLILNPQACNEVMESVVRVVTFTGTRKIPENQLLTSRKWSVMTSKSCGGRYIPHNPSEIIGNFGGKLVPIPGESFDMFMRRRMESQQVDTEINLQLGDFCLKSSPLTNLDRAFINQREFIDIFGQISHVQSCCISRTSHRHWVRLVGRRHDLQLWDQHAALPTLSTLSPTHSREY